MPQDRISGYKKFRLGLGINYEIFRYLFVEGYYEVIQKLSRGVLH